MPVKKRVSTNTKRDGSVKSNIQTVIVRVGDTPKKKTKRRPRRKRVPTSSGGDSFPMRQLPPVVYQVPAMTTGYVSQQPAILQPEPVSIPITMREPVRSPVAPIFRNVRSPISMSAVPTRPLFEDVGIVGTEGVGVEILSAPTRREQLTELITPVRRERDSDSVISNITFDDSDATAPVQVVKKTRLRNAPQDKPVGADMMSVVKTPLGFGIKAIEELDGGGLTFSTGRANIMNVKNVPFSTDIVPMSMNVPTKIVKPKRKYVRKVNKKTLEPNVARAVIALEGDDISL